MIPFPIVFLSGFNGADLAALLLVVGVVAAWRLARWLRRADR